MANDKIYCDKCGAENEVGSSFCKKCGANLHGTSAEKPSNVWYLLPILLGILGGIIGYIVIKAKDERMAKNILYVGLGTFVLGIIFIAAIPSPSPEVDTGVPTLTPISTPPEITPTIPPTTPEKTVTPSDIYASDETATLLIRTALSDQGIRGVITQVADGREKGGVKCLILGYISTALTENELAAETGYILGAYLGAAEGGWDIDELLVTVGDIDGNAVGMWYCTKDWTNDYINGKISIDELSLKVISSMTSF